MNTELIIDNQKRINNLMKKYEEETRKMIDCPVDDILMLTEKRKSISEAITALDEQIKEELGENIQARDAYMNKCNRGELSDELKPVFDLRQEFNSMAFRVRAAEPEIMERIGLLKEEIIEKIKKNNSGQNAKAAKYAQVGMPSGDDLYFPENKKMI